LFFAGTLALIKLEGAVLGGVLVFAWLAVQRFEPVRSRSWTTGLLMFVGLVAVWPLQVWTYHLRLEQGQYNAFEGVALFDLFGRVGRLPTIARAFVATGPRFLVPLAAVLALGYSAIRTAASARRVLTFFAIAAAAHSLWIVAVFLLTNLDVNWHLATALDRLVLQQVICLWTPALVLSAVTVSGRERSATRVSEGARRTGGAENPERARAVWRRQKIAAAHFAGCRHGVDGGVDLP